MKKLLLLILPLVLLTTSIWFGYTYYFGGKDFYTRVGEPTEIKTGIFSNGEKYTEYDYKQVVFNKKGEKDIQILREIRAKPLRINAYLKLKINPKKGVLSWEEISGKDVPKKALEQLTTN